MIAKAVINLNVGDNTRLYPFEEVIITQSYKAGRSADTAEVNELDILPIHEEEYQQISAYPGRPALRLPYSSNAMETVDIETAKARLNAFLSENSASEREEYAGNFADIGGWIGDLISLFTDMLILFLNTAIVSKQLSAEYINRQYKEVLSSADKLIKSGEEQKYAAWIGASVAIIVIVITTGWSMKNLSSSKREQNILNEDKKGLRINTIENKEKVDGNLRELEGLRKAQRLGLDSKELKTETDNLKTQINKEKESLASTLKNEADNYIKAENNKNEFKIKRTETEKQERNIELMERELKGLEAKVNNEVPLQNSQNLQNLQKKTRDLELDNLQLNSDNDRLHLSVSELDSQSERLRINRDKTTNLTQAGFHLATPLSKLMEAPGQAQSTEYQALSKTLEEVARVYQQIAGNDEDNKRKNDALREMLLKSIMDLMHTTQSAQSTLLSNMTIRG